jgi:hypothetical protein
MVTVPLARRGRDPQALHAALWEKLAEHITYRLLSSRPLRKIMTTYAAMQASDGRSSGDWCVSKDGLLYTFSDAAGLCVCESNAVLHWLELALLDPPSELKVVAAEHDAELAPSTRDPKRALQEKQSSILFMKGASLAYASQDDDPPSDHPIFLVDKATTLGRIPAADRAAVRDAIVRGVCLCEACEKLRAEHGLPLVAPTKKTKTKKSIELVEGPPLRDATVFTAADVDAGIAKDVVALDLSVSWKEKKSPSPSILAKLPSWPLRALSLGRNEMRTLPKEVLACPALEVLDLSWTMRVRFPAALADLTRLRAFAHQCNPRGTRSEDRALLCRIPSLEIIEDEIWGSNAPAALSEMTRLRHLEVSPRDDGSLPLLSKMALESVKTWGPFRELESFPLRYLDCPIEALPSTSPTLEFLECNQLPERAPKMPKLRGLSTCGPLPSWIGDLEGLELLKVSGTCDLSAIERLPALRCLVVDGAALAATKLDLRRLSSMRLLKIDRAIPSPDHIPDLRASQLEEVMYALTESDKGVTHAELAPMLPPGCCLAAPESSGQGMTGLRWFRALCTTRDAPEWWLARFWCGPTFERITTMLARA